MSELVDISQLKAHPRNFRRGDVDAIKRSLVAYGQIHSVTVSSRNNVILDGNHTVMAAKALGWSNILVNWVDVDEALGLKILIAANGVHEQGSYDNDVLLSMLQEIDEADLPPTGYDSNDIHRLLSDDVPLKLDEDSPKKEDETFKKIVVGTYYTTCPDVIFEPWSRLFKDEYGKQALNEIKDRLGFIMNDTLEPAAKISAQSPIVAQQRVAIDSLAPSAHNPRHGDVGAISASFQALGVFKPITVNMRTNTILAGNHRWMAAKALGYNEIDVEYIDVDPALEKAIILADNRIADLGENDKELLAELLMSMDDLSGLGYDLSTIGEGVPVERSSYKLNIGGIWKCSLSPQTFQRWRDDIGKFEQDPLALILERLGLTD